MLVVSDTSPVNILVRIGQIDLLAQLFGIVVVPTSVAEELSHAKAPEEVRRWIASRPSWFRVQTPSQSVNPSQRRHRGEQDAISLAQEVKADAILLDEGKPRADAAALGLMVVGTIGILERAADAGLFPDLQAVYDAIRKTNFHVSETLLKDSLARHKSRKT